MVLTIPLSVIGFIWRSGTVKTVPYVYMVKNGFHRENGHGKPCPYTDMVGCNHQIKSLCFITISAVMHPMPAITSGAHQKVSSGKPHAIFMP